MNDARLERLFTETLRLISEQGFYGTPMSQIAKCTGISIGSIYNQFENKEVLLNELYKKIKIDFANHVFEHLHAHDPIEKQLKDMLTQIFYYYLEHRQALNFIEQYENSPLIRPQTQQDLQPHVQRIVQTFKQGMQEHKIKELPAESLIALCFGAVSSLAKLYVRKAAQQIRPEEIDTLIDAVLSMARADSAGR
ncbi:TetR/AcrR family transcriptional regulator [Sporolactobacillus sp. CPB3-1]|uniref:TetR/AcrR family transcriptional regulator n=1 Tax=Sporolactobacillus mangiferae TaxID=2940498 RepID=A0ABT0MB17_9BACL|nr:TetR/AcrR family transcriptional regulator [Sporolactobacillus mangiferae]MCL1631474.1 TetR/AcrR family transcriptional regulator [Sporolactobacillus mangiferae]